MNRHRKPFLAVSLIAAAFLTSANARQANKGKPEPLMIQEQGSFAVGGKVITAPEIDLDGRPRGQNPGQKSDQVAIGSFEPIEAAKP